MLTTVIAALFSVSAVGPGMQTDPTEFDTKAVALLFDGAEGDEFEVFVKSPGKAWDETPAVVQAANAKLRHPWLVFRLGRFDVDYAIRIDGMDASETGVCDGPGVSLGGYLGTGDPGGGSALNNFGLHEIY